MFVFSLPGAGDLPPAIHICKPRAIVQTGTQFALERNLRASRRVIVLQETPFSRRHHERQILALDRGDVVVERVHDGYSAYQRVAI
jgi:hypothetical protein